MSLRSRARFALKAIQELGLKQTFDYARYLIGLNSGYYKFVTNQVLQKAKSYPTHYKLHQSLVIPDSKKLTELLGSEGINNLLTEADEITNGKVRLFGGPPIHLELNSIKPLAHWTEYESGNVKLSNRDIKWIWEPGRFGWAFTLGRAYWQSKDEKYAQSFWQYFEFFQLENPPYMGPQWTSGQEVALRLMAFVFAAHVFAQSPSSTSKRKNTLAQAIAIHAARIPHTMIYAQAQNNNHLLSESAGLITAALSLPNYPQAGQWLKLGSHWFNNGLQTQIAPDGTYVQHSTNYHRLMLQLALWVMNLKIPNASNHTQISQSDNHQTLSRSSLLCLAKATRWLSALLDQQSGQVPNLGPNDGALIFPFSICPYNDFRPVLQASCLAFFGERIFDPGPWDEMALWYNLPNKKVEKQEIGTKEWSSISTPPTAAQGPPIIRQEETWAYLRAAKFDSRPGHADQLHVDLWWRGINIAKDAGTYLYNGPLPWKNSLARTAVHNTIMIDGADQMRHAGRFLWLDWAQASIIDYDRSRQDSYDRLVAQHDGYRRINLTHRRAIEYQNREWIIKDDILPLLPNVPQPHDQPIGRPHNIDLHWLVPDWPWEIENNTDKSTIALRLLSPHGWIKLEIKSHTFSNSSCNLIPLALHIYHRGIPIYGTDRPIPILGWVSPTYGYKYPALSIQANTTANIPLTLVSRWIFSD